MTRNPREDDSDQPNDTEMLLMRHILRAGEQHVATRLGLKAASICRKVNGSEGWTLRQLGQLLPLLGLRITESVADDEEIEALKTLARKYLETL